MADKEHREYCDSHKDMEHYIREVATFMGRIDATVKNLKEDINVLFDQNREIIKDISKLREEVTGIKIKVFGLGVAGAIIFEALLFLKKWISK